jgi:uncharacterized membrane protein (UPF0127 family)
MQQVSIQNLNHPLSKPILAKYCTSFLCQLRGLTFKRNLPPDWGLLLVQRRDSRVDASIHMLFMLIDLAIVWIDSTGKVVDVKLAHRWGLAYLPELPARYVLELAIEHLEDFKVGDRVQIASV